MVHEQCSSTADLGREQGRSARSSTTDLCGFVRFERFCAFVRIRKMKVGLCDLKDEGGFER